MRLKVNLHNFPTQEAIIFTDYGMEFPASSISEAKPSDYGIHSNESFPKIFEFIAYRTFLEFTIYQLRQTIYKINFFPKQQPYNDLPSRWTITINHFLEVHIVQVLTHC
ncbi:hypothetical protein H6G41_25875 [Tolypothrix sp. FACHB-123]|uniref:hypothetical protein n=1 Tax=Tolypothrix sp. FACHB-123 TaxID=2692868 RepID=UPI00168501AB|nr:hypothetical protein [Tolypothrix sp. FACHB-123]MBD2357998.1 hypothetical protein [Tolypothrix sp. FACHB-123]